MPKRPIAVAFDVVETLFSLEPLRPRFQKAGLPPQSVDEWFARMIRDAFALDATGIYRPFREVARASLEVLLAEHHIDREVSRVDGILAGFAELPAHPDVRPAFERLRNARVRVAALTNGNAQVTAQLLKRNNLEGLVERVISIDEIQRWKPSREVYLHAARGLNVAPADLAMVAVHAWDIHGAARAGLTTAWVSRREKHFQPLMGPVTVRGDTLDEAARRLLELPA
jgi:2-haloacid dehalogenase